MDSNSIYKTHLIKSKSGKILSVLQVNICIILIFFPSTLSNSIKVKIYQSGEGNIPLINSMDYKRGCPTKISERGDEHHDENKCFPYLLYGEHNLDIDWNYNFEDCSNMFEYKTAITEIDLTYFDTSKVKYMGLMFKGCTSLKKVIMPTISEYLLEQAEMMFKGCTKLISVQFQHDFRTVNVKQMNEMFEGCSNLISVNFPNNFETPNSKYINNMFLGCSSLNSINFNIFKTSNTINMACLFQNTKLTSYDLKNFDTSQVTDMEYMFYNCTELISVNLTNFAYSSLKKMDYMFSNNDKLECVDFGKNEIREGISTLNIFNNSNKKTIIYVNKKKPESFFNETNFAIVECGDASPRDIMNEYTENKIVCVQNCKDLTNYKYKYINRCYIECPPNSITNTETFICEKKETITSNFLDKQITTIPEIITSAIIPTTTKEIPNPPKTSTIIPTTQIEEIIIPKESTIIPSTQIEKPNPTKI